MDHKEDLCARRNPPVRPPRRKIDSGHGSVGLSTPLEDTSSQFSPSKLVSYLQIPCVLIYEIIFNIFYFFSVTNHNFRLFFISFIILAVNVFKSGSFIIATTNLILCFCLASFFYKFFFFLNNLIKKFNIDLPIKFFLL